MKQLRRLKEMITGAEETEKQKKSEEQVQQSESTKSKISEEKSEKKQSVSAEDKEKSIKEKEKSELKAEQVKTESEKSKDKSSLGDPEKAGEKPKKERSDSMTLLDGRDVQTATRGEIDENFKQQVMDAGAESLALCFQCGTCTGACPSGRRTPYRIRQLVRRSLMGFKEDLMADDTIWMCTTCYECQERCPRAIKIVDIVKIVRNHASQAGYMGAAHKAVGSFVIKTGHGVPINDVTKELRKRVGLTELPPTTHEFPEALEEVQNILKTTKFDSLIGYNWETGELE